jgi:hypothetical protein
MSDNGITAHMGKMPDSGALSDGARFVNDRGFMHKEWSVAHLFYMPWGVVLSI